MINDKSGDDYEEELEVNYIYKKDCRAGLQEEQESGED